MADRPERHVLVWLDQNRAIDRRTIRPILDAIEQHIDPSGKGPAIDIWLDSPGGDAHAAYKLALCIQTVASHVRVAVPDYAKSAATLLTLAGNDIYLAPSADLGPLDAQMPDEGSYTGSISALNIARAADEVAREAVEMAVVGGADLLRTTGLSRAQTIDAMLSFSATFSEPLVRQLDPKVVHHAKQMLKVTAQYAERLLKGTECAQANEIAQALVETFPTHGYIISLAEATDLGLPVHPMHEYEHAEAVRELHNRSSGLITFCPIDDLVDPPTTKKKAAKKEGVKRNGKSTSQGEVSGTNGSKTRSRSTK